MYNKWAGPSEKGAYGFSYEMTQYNYDITLGNVQHLAHMLQQNTATFIFFFLVQSQ